MSHHISVERMTEIINDSTIEVLMINANQTERVAVYPIPRRRVLPVSVIYSGKFFSNNKWSVEYKDDRSVVAVHTAPLTEFFEDSNQLIKYDIERLEGLRTDIKELINTLKGQLKSE